MLPFLKDINWSIDGNSTTSGTFQLGGVSDSFSLRYSPILGIGLPLLLQARRQHHYTKAYGIPNPQA